MKKYVLTGGPGTGKSSIILSLEAKGEYVIREGAEDYIRLRQAAGAKTPWTEPDFQDRILDLQLQREARVPKGATRVFIDRGVADGLAYAKEGTETYKRIEDAGKITRYDKIFSIENLGSTEKTEVRRENNDEAQRIGRKLEEIYTKLGYAPKRIEAGALEERVAKILRETE